MNDRTRQILVFLDGTNNTLTGHRTDTNVLHLFEHVSKRRDPRQIVYYDPGVGSPDQLPFTGIDEWLSRKWERLSGLASGRGIFENVGQAYMFIAKNYKEGDQIFLFGFSRGAFTARSVAGMIHLFGLIRPEHEVLLPTLLRVYFARSGKKDKNRRSDLSPASSVQISRKQRTPPQSDSILLKKKFRDEVAEQIRESFTNSEGGAVHVHFVGVWDTVATVGLWPFNLRISSTATISDKRIDNARHALSLDEHRSVFEPRLYSENNFEREDRSLKQIWFHGVHCDVGGGYIPKKSGLSNEALRWMADEAKGCELRCDPTALSAEVEGLAGSNKVERWIHDPLKETGLWAVVGMQVRDTKHPRGDDGAGKELEAVPFRETPGAPVPKSVWSNWLDVVWAMPLFLAALLTTIASGSWALPAGVSFREGSMSYWKVAKSALAAGRHFADLQAFALWKPEGSLEQLKAIGTGNSARVLALDYLYIVFYAVVLSILLARAFARAAGWRAAGDGSSWLSWLGLALPVLIVGDLVENTLGLLAIWARSGWLATTLLWLGSIGSWAKIGGLTACLALLVWGVAFPSRSMSGRTPKETR